MTDRIAALLEQLQRAIAGAEPSRVERALARAVADLTSGSSRVDGLGAPRGPISRPEPTWDDLRAVLKNVVQSVGYGEAAKQFGAEPGTLRDLLYRRRPPGRGRRARLEGLLRIVN